MRILPRYSLVFCCSRRADWSCVSLMRPASTSRCPSGFIPCLPPARLGWAKVVSIILLGPADRTQTTFGEAPGWSHRTLTMNRFPQGSAGAPAGYGPRQANSPVVGYWLASGSLLVARWSSRSSVFAAMIQSAVAPLTPGAFPAEMSRSRVAFAGLVRPPTDEAETAHVA